MRTPPSTPPALAISYVGATAISSLADALETLLLDLTGGYNTMPRGESKRRAIEAGCDAIATYRRIIGVEIEQRVHRELCGHIS
jgi:hypothetical protein